MENKSFTDVSLIKEPHLEVAYRTGLTTYQEALINGQFVGRGWNGQGYLHYDWLLLDPSTHPTPQAFWLEVDGQLLHSHWEWCELTKDESDGKIHAAVTLKHSIRPIGIKVHTILDGTPIITRWIEITNTGDTPAAISAVSPWSGVLHTASQFAHRPGDEGFDPVYSIGYTVNPHWGSEGNFQWHKLPNAGYRIDGNYRRLRHRQPMFVLENHATGEHFIGQLEWSGGWAFEFDYDTFPDSQHEARLFFRSGPDAPSPLRMIESGETVTTPKMHLGYLIADFDATVQAMHEHLRKTVFLPQPRGRGGWVETGIGPEHEITPELVRHNIDIAAKIGAEIFFIDASWYNNLGESWETTIGDWNVGARFPEGLKPIRDYVKSKGLLWGLWMEPERLGEKSQTYKEHPEWVMKYYAGGPERCWLDLTKPEVAKWVEDQICRVVTEHELDFFRLDYNIGSPQGGGMTIRNGYMENNYWRYYEAFYGIFERIRKHFPDLILENCAGGGSRTDIGTVRLFSHTWVTDYQVAPRSFSITNGMTIALPPEYVDRLLLGIGQTPHVAGELDFQARLALFGRPSINTMFSPPGVGPNPMILDRIKRTVNLYKNFVRPFQSTSRIYHHTPTVTECYPKGFGALEMVAKDRSKAIAGIFNLGNTDQKEYLFRFRGLDVGKRYRVTTDGIGSTWEADGRELVYGGVMIRLEAALTSELLICEVV
jgi:alpha-galactosidase